MSGSSHMQSGNMNAVRRSVLDDRLNISSDEDQDHDSEVEELSRGASLARAAKRRKLSHSSTEEEADLTEADEGLNSDADVQELHEISSEVRRSDDVNPNEDSPSAVHRKGPNLPPRQPPSETNRQIKKTRESKPGVVYLSSLPPYLRPSALRNLLTQRGFGPLNRLFLTPASKASSHSKKNSRQLYTEGWIEFGSKKVARRCAETLNATPVGGKKGGFYRDDVWNMKYLRGMGWDELMAGVREERREEEGRRDEERRIIVGEAKRFVEGVEKGRREEGMKRKKKRKDPDADEEAGVKRTWRQFEVKGKEHPVTDKSHRPKSSVVDQDVQAVLGQIF